MLSYIREIGFDDAPKPKLAVLPVGIHRRGNKFTVKYIKDAPESGTRYGYRLYDSLDEANSFKLELLAAQHQEPQPHDAADETDDGNVEADTHEDDGGAAGEGDAEVA